MCSKQCTSGVPVYMHTWSCIYAVAALGMIHKLLVVLSTSASTVLGKSIPSQQGMVTGGQGLASLQLAQPYSGRLATLPS